VSDENLLALRAEAASGTAPRAPLFIIVAPGVNALGYVALARLLPEDQPIYLVQPRQKGRSFPAEGIGPGGRDEYPLVAAEYLASIRTVQAKGPYHFTGMCDGALIAVEMARALEAAGERVAAMTLLDTWPLENTSIYPLVLADIAARALQARSGAERWRLVEQKLRGAAERGAALAGVREAPSAQVEAAEREAERKARWRARLWPGRGFAPVPIEAPIAVLRAEQQPFWRIRDEALGWRTRTRGVVTVHILPGDHHTLARAPHAESWARVMAAYLDRAILPVRVPGQKQRRRPPSPP
jgi:thioesterase domain-containing protein